MGLITCLVILVATIAGYFKWIHTYWRRRGINGPVGLPLLGNFYDVADVQKPRGFVIYGWAKKFGKTFGFYEGVTPVLVTSDMDMLQEMFIKKFDYFYARKSTNLIHGDLENSNEEPRVNLFSSRGARWKRLRSLASPAFSVKALKQVHNVVEDSVMCMTELLQKHEDGKQFNIHTYYQEFTFDVISRLAMGQPQSELFNNPGVEIVKNIFSRDHRVLPWYLANIFPKFEYYVKLAFANHPNVTGGDFGKLIQFCNTAVQNRLKEREENAKLGFENTQNDFIDMFLDYYSAQIDDISYGETIEKKVTAQDVVGSSIVFLLAGFDTTANTLACASHALAQHPEKQKKLQEEIDSIFTSDTISYDDMGRMKYLDAVIKESLRLYPVAFFACSRECVKSTTLGGIEIEKGTRIEADVMSLHRNKETWGADADEFVPERWLSNTPRHVMSWIPFGAGPRTCVGMKLGLSEAKLALSHVLKKYTLLTGPETEKELHYGGCTTTSPDAVTLYLKSRF